MDRNPRATVITVGIVAILAVSLLSACSEAETPAPSPPAPQELPTQPAEPSAVPKEEITPIPPAETGQPVILEGETLVQERCTACHGIQRIEQASKTEAEWRETVMRMVGRGADLNEEEQEAVILYLSRVYGP